MGAFPYFFLCSLQIFQIKFRDSWVFFLKFRIFSLLVAKVIIFAQKCILGIVLKKGDNSLFNNCPKIFDGISFFLIRSQNSEILNIFWTVLDKVLDKNWKNFEYVKFLFLSNSRQKMFTIS